MNEEYRSLQNAVFDRFYHFTSWNELAQKHSVEKSALRRAFKRWACKFPESQPVSPADIHIPMRVKDRPCLLTADEEEIIVDAINFFASNNTTLTKSGVKDLVQHYVSLMPAERRKKIGFADNYPSNTWVSGFARRHNLASKAVHIVEDRRLEAVTMPVVTEHIGRVNAALTRYNIKDPRRIFNLDQSGASFAKMTGRSMRKGVGPSNMVLIQSTVRTKGSLERVTVMPVVSAAGMANKPVIVFPGKQAHFRRVRDEVQTLHSFLPPCYLYQRELPGVDSDIFYDWAHHFLEETKKLRENCHYLLLVLDGYSAHVQFRTLQLLKENNIIVIALPAHTSHVLQPLDVSVFSSYKSYLQQEIHRMSRCKKFLDAFDIAHCIKVSYSASTSAKNIMSGFVRTGIWDGELLKGNVEPLMHLFEGRAESGHVRITLERLLSSFTRQSRTLLREADVRENGTIRINTKAGAHLTADAVLDALRERNERRRGGKAAKRTVEEQSMYKEAKADIQRLLDLAPQRIIQRRRLAWSRHARRAMRVARALASKEALS